MKTMEEKIIPVNKGIPEKLFDEIIKTNLSCRFFIDMGIYVSALDRGYAEIKCRIHEGHINPRGLAHGAVYCAILDTAMGMVIRTVNYNCVTIQLSSDFIRSAKLGEMLTGKAHLDHHGKKIFFAKAQLFNEKGDLLLTSSGSFYNKGPFIEI